MSHTCTRCPGNQSTIDRKVILLGKINQKYKIKFNMMNLTIINIRILFCTCCNNWKMWNKNFSVWDIILRSIKNFKFHFFSKQCIVWEYESSNLFFFQRIAILSIVSWLPSTMCMYVMRHIYIHIHTQITACRNIDRRYVCIYVHTYTHVRIGYTYWP